MNDNICKSWKNVDNKNIRCHRPVCKNSDFCKYHKRWVTYMPEFVICDIHKVSTRYLDDNYIHNLFGIYDSWQEIPNIYWININNKWWDKRILLNLFANQINACDMNNPLPTYPFDPFTKRLFLPNELSQLKNSCLDMKINIALLAFINSNVSYVYRYAHDQRKMSSIICNILSRTLRFRLMPNKNSQHCFNGMWVPKKYPKNEFEILYDKYINEPIQIIDFSMNFPLIVNNTNVDILKNKLNAYPIQEIDLFCDDFCTHI